MQSTSDSLINASIEFKIMNHALEKLSVASASPLSSLPSPPSPRLSHHEHKKLNNLATPGNQTPPPLSSYNNVISIKTQNMELAHNAELAVELASAAALVTFGFLADCSTIPVKFSSPSHSTIKMSSSPTPMDTDDPPSLCFKQPQLCSQQKTCFSPTASSPNGSIHPLWLPEILLHIFSFLETPLNTGTDPTKPLDFVKIDSIKYTISKPKLHSCVRVSKLWNACATKLLWRNVKIGSKLGCQRICVTLARPQILQSISTLIRTETDIQDAHMILTPPNELSSKQRCIERIKKAVIPSVVNGWIHGNLLRHFTLIPPHGPAAQGFELWNVDQLVSMLAISCPNLEDLNLSNCSQVTDRSMILIAKNCSRLKRLSLNRCDLISSVTVFNLAEHCHSLEILNLSRPLLSQRTTISDDAIFELVNANVNLMELRLRNCDLVTDRTIIKMANQSGANLRALDLSWCYQITDAAIIHGIGPNAPRLQSLALNGCKRLTDLSLKSLLSHCPDISSLSLAHLPFITDSILTAMAKQLKNLVILSLNGCSNVGDDSVIALTESCPLLQSLSLFSLRITDRSVEQMTRSCTSLVSLSISGCSLVTDEGAIYIGRLPRLQSLYLNAAQITDKSVMCIAARCRYIRALSLNDCKLLTDKSIVFLARLCNQIQSLSMNGCHVTAVGIRALVERCVDIRELSIKNCELCHLDGDEGKKLVWGNGGMELLSAIGEEVLQKLQMRKVALMR